MRAKKMRGGEWLRERGEGGEKKKEGRKREKIREEKTRMNFLTSRARRSDLGRRELAPARPRTSLGRVVGAHRLDASAADREC